ncbi:MAG: hypothetical protein H6940_05065 [Burkholderiales bacterium]|nr:hypothetical protein [Burkholderiales bacterium]
MVPSWTRQALKIDSRNKGIKRRFKYIRLFINVLIGASCLSLAVSFSFSVQNTNKIFNEIVNSITQTTSSMASALSKSNARAETQTNISNTLPSSNTFPLGLGNATIYEKFQNSIQACWYYQSTYQTLHPYTVLWNETKIDEDSKKDFSIRAIASEGTWEADRCIKRRNRAK